jgi:hypothetical protein
MTVERRELEFDNLDQVLADMETLASGNVRTTGSFSFGQIVEHLARTLDVVTGQLQSPQVPLPMRVMARMMRPFILSRPMRPGFKLPSKAQSVLWPSEDIQPDQAIQHFREALRRYQAMEPLPKHPFFGNMTRAQHDQLQCGHCAMHLGFVHPA